MPQDTLTVKEIAQIMGMHSQSINKYVSAYEPRLVHSQEIRNGKATTVVTRADFETWRTEYESKKPFGSKLHKDKKPKRADTEPALGKAAVKLLGHLLEFGGGIVHDHTDETYWHAWEITLKNGSTKWQERPVKASVFEQIKPFLILEEVDDEAKQTTYLPSTARIAERISR